MGRPTRPVAWQRKAPQSHRLPLERFETVKRLSNQPSNHLCQHQDGGNVRQASKLGLQGQKCTGPGLSGFAPLQAGTNAVRQADVAVPSPCARSVAWLKSHLALCESDESRMEGADW